jgi:polysaccharide export outer membrane protein
MERSRADLRRIARSVWPIVLVAGFGCQTVRTPEEQIAATPIPRELSKTSMPEYVVSPPDLLLVEVLEALPGRPITGERLIRPDGTITLGFYGDVYVNGLTVREIKEKVIIHLRKFITDEVLGLTGLDEKGDPIYIDPVDSDRVFVDVAAYNSQVYYVQGDVAAPGRLPITGNETVLDAINYAGGLAPTASFPNVRLVRPAPAGTCAPQILPINLAAIIQEGDPTTNYQLMPGDRIFVYRDPIVRGTLLLDRMAAPFNTVLSSMLQYNFVKRTLNGSLFGGGSSTSTGSGRTFATVPLNTPAR